MPGERPQRDGGIGASESLDVVQPIADEMSIPEPGDGEALQKEAGTNRPEILRSALDIKAAEQGVKLAKRSAEPDLSLAFGYAHQPDAGGFNPRTDTWQASATFRMAIFDGGLASARTRQARANVELAKTYRKNTQEQVALEVEQALLNFKNAQERIPVAGAALTEARESYRLAQIRYKAGITQTPTGSPLLEISDAQTALTRADNDFVNAQYDLLTARAGLDRALGRYAYGEKPGVASATVITSKVKK